MFAQAVKRQLEKLTLRHLSAKKYAKFVYYFYKTVSIDIDRNNNRNFWTNKNVIFSNIYMRTVFLNNAFNKSAALALY